MPHGFFVSPGREQMEVETHHQEKAMSAISNVKVMGVRKETDSLGEVDVPSAKLWGRKRNARLSISTSGRI
jgi:hypothetical protein